MTTPPAARFDGQFPVAQAPYAAGAAARNVIIPASNEQAVIGRCLDALLDGSRPGEFSVLVVVNGSSDATVAVARTAGLKPLANGRPAAAVRVEELPEASKVAAWRRGRAALPPGPTIFLDADVILPAPDARALFDAVSAAVPRVASPALVVDTTRSSGLVRHYFAAWSSLPYARRHLLGSGVFAVSEAGLQRLGPFPDVLNDDGWVRRHFSPEERLEGVGTFTAVAPRTTAALIRRRARVALGNRELAARMGRDADGNGIGDLVVAVRAGQVRLASAAAFVLVTAAVRLLAGWRRLSGTARTWSPDLTSREAA